MVQRQEWNLFEGSEEVAVEEDEEEGGEEDDEGEEGDESEDEEDVEDAGDAEDEDEEDEELGIVRRLEEAEKTGKPARIFDKKGLPAPILIRVEGMGVRCRRLRSDFVEAEAELSGSENGEGDEDELGLDEMEAEEGDLDLLPEEHQLRAQLVRLTLRLQPHARSNEIGA